MRDQSPPYLHHLTRAPRTPGPDPTPVKRRSTKSQKEQPQASASEVSAPATPTAVPKTPQAEAKAKARKKKGCGSQKPRAVLSRELMRLAIRSGLIDLLDERREQAEEKLLEEKKLREAAEVSSSSEAKSENYITSVVIDEHGKEKVQFIIDGKVVPDGPDSESKPSKTPAEIMAERKVAALLKDMKDIRLSLNVGELVKAAMQDPRLAKMIKDAPDPKKPPANGLGNKTRSLKMGGQKVQIKKKSDGSPRLSVAHRGIRH